MSIESGSKNENPEPTPGSLWKWNDL